MKHPYLLFTLFITVISSGALGQDRSGFEQNFKIIDQELKNWDPIRGAWMSNTMVAMAFDERCLLYTSPSPRDS